MRLRGQLQLPLRQVGKAFKNSIYIPSDQVYLKLLLHFSDASRKQGLSM